LDALHTQMSEYGTLVHPAIAKTLLVLGSALAREQRLVEAIGAFEQVTNIVCEIYGTEQHPDAVAALRGIAYAREVLGVGTASGNQLGPSTVLPKWFTDFLNDKRS
jgi:hypothetical protein